MDFGNVLSSILTALVTAIVSLAGVVAYLGKKSNKIYHNNPGNPNGLIKEILIEISKDHSEIKACLSEILRCLDRIEGKIESFKK